MHYYSFNIGDYTSHTSHLEPLEDIAYRRMIDYCYLNEIGLPKSKEEIARLIRMRAHCDCIANVLREFFTLDGDCYFHKRVEKEIEKYKSKSDKAKESANARWSKTKALTDANALRPECVRNANHKPITNNHKPITNKKSKGDKSPPRFQKPTLDELIDEFEGKVFNSVEEANTFLNHFNSNGWKVGGKAPMKCWKSAVRNWAKRSNENGKGKSNSGQLTKSQLRDQQARDAITRSENNGGAMANAPILGIGPRRT